MAMKEVLAAAGLLGVIAPAAFAATALMNGNAQSYDFSKVQEAISNALIAAGLESLLANADDAGQGSTPASASSAMGNSRMLADLIGPRITDFDGIDLDSLFDSGNDPFAHGGGADASPTSMALAASSGSVGRQDGSRTAGSSGARAGGESLSTGGAAGAADAFLRADAPFGAGGGAGSGAGGGADGGGASGAAAERLVLDDDANGFGSAPDDGMLAAVPLPTSVWMLLAALAGLGVVGYRRGAE